MDFLSSVGFSSISSFTENVNSLRKYPSSWRCELTLDLKPKKDPNSAYIFHLVLVGFFFVLKDYPKDIVEMLARTNSPAILYSTAREMLVTVVRRSPFAPVLIPSVTFLEIDKKQSKDKKSESTKISRQVKKLK